ncbi:ribokinase [Talaromyces proteolyticus]|uniref:Ribokinase n=1 Tax=Talaromyces proteolyticus TaxID=1131652 RepID=A0AAD4KYM4_9EURO|nr:ribokinase [Talaromyces proteolyticus]KAH8700466.1 ribokinase [Talaromyces proteolyticus]
MSSHICVVGSLNVDFTVSTHRCPGPGETITARCLSVSPGGKGANQAVACGRALFASPSSLQSQQDVTVSMIGAVGSMDGHYPNLIQPMLEKSGVDTTDVDERIESQTGSATIIVEDAAHGENRILVVPGANHEGMRNVQRIITTIRDRQQQRQLDAPNVIILQGEIPRETVLRLLEHFNNNKECSTHIVFNPAPVFPEGVPLSALARTSVLVMNETEAAQMERSILGDRSSATNLTLEKDEFMLEELAKGFHEVAGVRIVLITLGARGVYFSTSTGRKGIVKGVPVQNVVDTTAAGDTFVGYFAVTFARFLGTSSAKLEDFDMIIEQAVREANSASAVCVQRQGAMQSIPFAYEIKSE